MKKNKDLSEGVVEKYVKAREEVFASAPSAENMITMPKLSPQEACEKVIKRFYELGFEYEKEDDGHTIRFGGYGTDLQSFGHSVWVADKDDLWEYVLNVLVKQFPDTTSGTLTVTP